MILIRRFFTEFVQVLEQNVENEKLLGHIYIWIAAEASEMLAERIQSRFVHSMRFGDWVDTPFRCEQQLYY